MAKGWRATTNIQHGAKDGEQVTFEPGDPVTGLTKEQMAELWEAGALIEAEVEDSKASPRSDSPSSTRVSTEGGGTEGEETPTA